MMRATILAVVGMVVLAGSAQAGLCKKKSGVLVLRPGACKAKETAVTASDIGAVGPQGPQGAQGASGAQGAEGPQGPAGPGARWAIVAEDGTISAQSGGISVAATITGGVYLDFGTSLTGKVLSATVACTDSDCGARGTVSAGRCGGGAGGVVCIAPGTNTDHHMFVYTLNPANNANQGHPFFIAAF